MKPLTAKQRPVYDAVVTATKNGTVAFTGALKVPGMPTVLVSSHLNALEARGLINRRAVKPNVRSLGSIIELVRPAVVETTVEPAPMPTPTPSPDEGGGASEAIEATPPAVEQTAPAEESAPAVAPTADAPSIAVTERNVTRTLDFFSRTIGEIVVRAAAEIDTAIRRAGAELAIHLTALQPQPAPAELQPAAATSVAPPPPAAPPGPHQVPLAKAHAAVYEAIRIATGDGTRYFVGRLDVPGLTPQTVHGSIPALVRLGLIEFNLLVPAVASAGRSIRLTRRLDGTEVPAPAEPPILPPIADMLSNQQRRAYDAVAVATEGGAQEFVGKVSSPYIRATEMYACLQPLKLLGLIDFELARPGDRYAGRRIRLLKTLDGKDIQPSSTPTRSPLPAGPPGTPAPTPPPSSAGTGTKAPAAAPTPKETCPVLAPPTPVARVAPAASRRAAEREDSETAGSDLVGMPSGPAFARGQPRAVKGSAPWTRRGPIKANVPHLPVRPQDLAANRSAFLALGPVTPQLMLEQDEKPALAGPAGHAWLHRAPPYRACDRARLGTWIIDLWPSKPAWSVYALSLAHLRDIGAEDLSICKPSIRTEGDTHELVLVQVDSRWPVDLDQPFFWLEPFVFEAQFFATSDAAALEVAEASIRDLCLTGLTRKNGADGLPFLHRFRTAAIAAGAHA